MALILKITEDSISNNGDTLMIKDISTGWGDTQLGDRNSYGMFLKAEFRLSEDPVSVTVGDVDPFSTVEWNLSTPKDGRYTVTAYIFPKRDLIMPKGDTVGCHSDGKLYQWSGSEWVEIALEEAIDYAEEESSTIDIPLLSHSYAYKNVLNLDYIRKIKGYTSRGASRNKLFYKRNDLDYFKALITGAEYNWVIQAYNNFYSIVGELDNFIETGKID